MIATPSYAGSKPSRALQSSTVTAQHGRLKKSYSSTIINRTTASGINSANPQQLPFHTLLHTLK